MKRKILFAINTMGRGGAEKAMIELIKQLDPSRYEIHLFALIARGEMFTKLPAHVRVLGPKPDSGSVLSLQGRMALAKTILKCMVKKGGIISGAPYLVRNWKKQRQAGRVQPDKLFWKLISDRSPRFDTEYDLAIGYLEGGATYYVSEHVQARHKIAFVHTNMQLAGYIPSLDSHLYDCMEAVFSVSEEVGRIFSEMYPAHADKVALFHNVTDVEGIRESARKGAGFTDAFEGVRLLTIGRLQPYKAYDVAIPALAELLRRGVNARWYVLGEGPERQNLEKLIREQGLEDRFFLLGDVENPYPYIRQCDLYVHATRFEGKSLAITEAQVLGKPIVASDCSGNTEQIVSGEDGLLIALSVENLADGIQRVLCDGALRRKFVQAVQAKDFSYPEDIARLCALADN